MHHFRDRPGSDGITSTRFFLPSIRMPEGVKATGLPLRKYPASNQGAGGSSPSGRAIFKNLRVLHFIAVLLKCFCAFLGFL
jgi:hypothetical protein